ncbi:MAG TPA: TspO/MBR family protein [Candidatus Limnocylindrales bacterium]|nr:TspO/MBR family protein [Candidatus Limnocylindrales bacterium]
MAFSLRRPSSGIRPVDGLLVALPLAVGGVTGALTAGSIRTWYQTLDKPGFTPPGAVFGPVWTALYASMGLALVLLRQADDDGADPARVRTAAGAFALQLALNSAWSVLFFNAHAIDAALVELVVLWLAIALTIVALGRVRRSAGLILLPYLAWVTFAGVLNAGIAVENA